MNIIKNTLIALACTLAIGTAAAQPEIPMELRECSTIGIMVETSYKLRQAMPDKTVSDVYIYVAERTIADYEAGKYNKARAQQLLDAWMRAIKHVYTYPSYASIKDVVDAGTSECFMRQRTK